MLHKNRKTFDSQENNDKQFLKQVFFVINFCESSADDRRTLEMKDRLFKILGREVPVTCAHLIQAKPRRIAALELWESIKSLHQEMDLDHQRLITAKKFAYDMALELIEELGIAEKIIRADENELHRFAVRIEALKEAQHASEDLIKQYHLRLTLLVSECITKGINDIFQRVRCEVEEAGRFTDANSCTAYIREHLISLEIEKLNNRLIEEVRNLFEELLEKLEGLAIKPESLSPPEIFVPEPGAGEFIKEVKGTATRAGAELATFLYLRRLGGAVGEKAGIVNLAKMAVSRGGRMFGVTFRRTVYDKMGRTLKALGITASRAAFVFAVVVWESVSYIYKTATWKRSLLAVTCRVLGLPVQDEPILDQLKMSIPFFRGEQKPLKDMLFENYNSNLTGCINDTAVLVREDYDRKINTLQSMLKKRQENSAGEIQGIQLIKKRLEEILIALDKKIS